MNQDQWKGSVCFFWLDGWVVKMFLCHIRSHLIKSFWLLFFVIEFIELKLKIISGNATDAGYKSYLHKFVKKKSYLGY